jgi:hypothetical protein
MTRRLLFLLSVVSLTTLSSCGGSSPAAPTPTPKPVIRGILTASVLSAYGTRENGGVRLHVTVRFVETAGGATTLTKVEFMVKQSSGSGVPYENTEPHAIGAKGSLELNYQSEPSNDPYPASVDVTGTYTDNDGLVKTATATGTFVALPPG